VGACVAHATLYSTGEVLDHISKRSDERDISFDTFSAEGLRVDISSCLLLLGHISSN